MTLRESERTVEPQCDSHAELRANEALHHSPAHAATHTPANLGRGSSLGATARGLSGQAIVGLYALLMLAALVFCGLMYTRVTDVVTVSGELTSEAIPENQHAAALKVAVTALEPVLYRYYATEDQLAFRREYAPLSATIRAGLLRIAPRSVSARERASFLLRLNAMHARVQTLDRNLSSTRTDWDAAREELAQISALSVDIQHKLDRVTQQIAARVAERSRHTDEVVSHTRNLAIAASIAFVIAIGGIVQVLRAYLRSIQSVRALAAFPERNPVAVMRISTAGEVMYANESAHHLLRQIAADGEDLRALLPDGLADRLRALLTGDEAPVQWEYERAERVLLCHAHRVNDPLDIHAYISDVTEQRAARAALEHAAYFDSLTNLPNRHELARDLASALGRGKVSVIMLKLDRISTIAQVHGPLEGDDTLKAAAGQIQATLKQQSDNTVRAYRLNGSVFVVACSADATTQNTEHSIEAPHQVFEHHHARQIATRLVAAFDAPLDVGEREHFLTASAGIACYPTHGAEPMLLLKQAETALQSARLAPDTRVLVYADSMRARLERRASLEQALRNAVTGDELALVYQPQVNIKSGKIVGVEALLRWVSGTLGAVNPAEFISVAEETGVIDEIGAWALSAACTQTQRWHAQGFAALKCAVNVSPRQFAQSNFHEVVAQTLQRTGVRADAIEIELTESAALHDIDAALVMLRELKALGVAIAIDDFGTGYSSLSYLRVLTIDKLKIDRAFVKDVHTDARRAGLLKSVVALGQTLGFTVVAEGVERPEELALLSDFGCDLVQGYLTGRPMTAANLTAALEAQTNTNDPVAYLSTQRGPVDSRRS